MHTYIYGIDHRVNPLTLTLNPKYRFAISGQATAAVAQGPSYVCYSQPTLPVISWGGDMYIVFHVWCHITRWFHNFTSAVLYHLPYNYVINELYRAQNTIYSYIHDI